MPRPRFDCLVCRVCAAAFAALALFGWDWGSMYRKDLLDVWELPILATCLAVGALLPREIAPLSAWRAVRWILVFACGATLVVWIVEKARMANGSYDIGGIALRAITYG